MAAAQDEIVGVAVGNEKYDRSGDETPETSSGQSFENNAEQKPVCLIVLGMAGSGKTTFVQVNTSKSFLHLYSYRLRLLYSDWLLVYNSALAIHQGAVISQS